MKTSTIIRDKRSGSMFAILIGRQGAMRAFGAKGQGDSWAQWANTHKHTDSALDSLDASLVAEDNVQIDSKFIDSIADSFDPQVLNDIRAEVSKKAIISIISTKSLDPKNEGSQHDYEDINEFQEEEEINNWPLTDVALATIDVAYKQIALDYKAKAFVLDTKRASTYLQVKGVRAMWDPNMPGGGGWRCPDETPNGGQFTNRLGRGCTFGAMRRIGRALLTSSLGDITKAMSEPIEAAKTPTARVGSAMLRAADKRDARLQEKFKNRAERRARRLSEAKAKKLLKDGRITWRMAYESLGTPSIDGEPASKRGRIETATALVARRIADDAVTRARNREFRRMGTRAARRRGAITEKLPDSNTSQISGSMSGGDESFRQRLAEKMRQLANDMITDPLDVGNRRTRRAKRRDIRNMANRLVSGRGPGQIARDAGVIRTGSTDDNGIPDYMFRYGRDKKRPLKKRKVRGAKPKEQQIARTFTPLELATIRAEQGVLRRSVRGRRPRSTSSFRERIAMRARRRAAYNQGEVPQLEDYPNFALSRINLPDAYPGGVKAESFNKNFSPTDSAREIKNEIDPILRNVPAPDSPTMPEYRDSAAMDVYVESREKWLQNPDVWKGMADLQKFFSHRMPHDSLRFNLRFNPMRQPGEKPRDLDATARAMPLHMLGSFDLAHQDELAEIYKQWQMSFNDPSQPIPEGFDSNMGLAIAQTTDFGTNSPIPLLDNNNRRIGDVPNTRVILYASDVPSRPVVYIEDKTAGIAHLLSKDGRHVMSIFLDNENNTYFMAGSAALEQMTKENMIKTPREFAGDVVRGVRNRFSKRGKQSAETASLRARRILVEAGKTNRTGRFYGRRSEGAKLEISPNASEQEISLLTERILNQVDKRLEFYDNKFRNLLDDEFAGKPNYKPLKDNLSTNITEDDLIQLLDARNRSAELTSDVAEKAEARKQAALLRNDIHNFLELSRIRETESINLVNNLKPSERDRVIGLRGARIPDEHLKFADVVTNTGKRQKTSWTFIEETPIRKSTAIDIDSLAKPIVVNQTIEDLPIADAQTGPKLIPGIGNPTGGIEYDPSSNAYIDTNTGLYIEDLSGLPNESFKDMTPIPTNVSDMQPGAYPVVDLSPPGVIPKRSTRLAPYSDPDIGGRLDQTTTAVTKTFKDSIAMFSANNLRNSVNRGGANLTANEELNAAVVAKVDMRGKVPSDMPNEPKPVAFNNFSIGEIVAAARDSKTGNDSLSVELDEFLPGVLRSTDGPDAKLKDVRTKQTWNGLDLTKPAGEAYFSVSSAKLEDDDSTLSALNKALQAEYNYQLNHSLSPQTNEALKDLDDVKANWVNATRALGNGLKNAESELEQAKQSLENNPRNVQAQRDYLMHGYRRELYRNLIDKHIRNNKAVQAILREESRRDAESIAKRKNARIIAARKREEQGANRTVGTFDNDPHILDPYDESLGITPPATPRTLEEIELLRSQHKTQGLFDNPLDVGDQQLNDAQMEAIEAMGLIFEQGTLDRIVGLPNTPYEGEVFYHPNISNQALRAMLAHMWHYNGYNSLPVLISKEELLKILSGPESKYGSAPAKLITRGVDGTAVQQEEYITNLLKGDRFIPGQGQSAAGLGDYYTMYPNVKWGDFHGGQNGTAIGILTPDMNIVSQEGFSAIYGEKRAGSPLYENMWVIVNATGAVGFGGGVNTSHGTHHPDNALPGSILPDPKTGMYSPQQIEAMYAIKDALMREGGAPTIKNSELTWSEQSGWGSGTIEAILSTGRSLIGSPVVPSNDMQRGLREDVEEAQETRRQINAWLSQHLSWFIQLHQMRRDESVPGQEGQSNKEWNKRINRMQQTLVYMNQYSRMVMMGYDAHLADSITPTLRPSVVWRDLTAGRGDRVIVLNRSAMLFHRAPVRHYSDWNNEIRNLGLRW